MEVRLLADNAKVIWNYFKAKGLSDCGIAGLMGNLYAESGLSPVNLQNSYEKKLGMTDSQYTQAVDNGSYSNFVKDSAGYGLAQWTYWSRKQGLLKLCRSRSKSIGDLSTQLDFLYQELSTSYSQLLKILKTTSSVEEASNLVITQFERPADQSSAALQRRAAYSQQFFNSYATQKEEATGMKYSDTNKPIVCMQTNSKCYKNTERMNPVGILWHSTGCNNPNLKRYVQPLATDANYNEMIKLLGKNSSGNDWNHVSVGAGLNCWIGKLADGSVATVQTMPWNYKPWGCGSGPKGSCNNGWIQFEICEDALNDANYFDKVYKEACELTAYLCKLYNIDPNGTVKYNGVTVPTILCHIDSNKLGLGSAHADVLHWFPKFGKNMTTVRQDVTALLNGNEEDDDMTQEKFNEMMEAYLTQLASLPATWEKDAMDWAQSTGLMAGNSQGQLMPKRFMTRGELATVLKRYSEMK